MAALSSSETPSPPPFSSHLNHNQEEGTSTSVNLMGTSPTAVLSISPCSESDKRFWSTLRSRMDSLLDQTQTHTHTHTHSPMPVPMNERLKQDSLLLIRGFDSVAHTLSLLSNNLDNALHCATQVAHPPTFTDILHTNLDKPENKQEASPDTLKQGLKRKFDHTDLPQAQENPNAQILQDRNIKRAKNLAVSMATKAASLARELKCLKSDLCFMQERCGLLEEENRRLRHGFEKGVRPDEDDLVRLQLEALLAEKSRLANENANLLRENQCLHQLVEYHQLASQDLSESYEHVIQGMCLDPPPATAQQDGDPDNNREPQTPKTSSNHLYKLSTSLDEDN